MTKKTTTSPEIIWDNKTIKGTEKIETVYPDTIKLPDYDYWLSQNTLDAELALRNNDSSWWWTVIKNYSRSSTDWTWVESYTWFWTIKYLEIHAWFDSSIAWERWSRGYWDWTTITWVYVYDSTSLPTTSILRISDWVNLTKATTVTLITDWFSIDFTDSYYDAKFTVIAHI